jgi:hypothetical protein
MGTTTIVIDQDKIAEFKAATPTIVRQAEAFEIVTADDYEASLPIREECKRRIDAILAFFKESKELAFKTHRAISTLEKEMVGPYERADSVIAQKRQAFRAAEEKKRQEEESRQREEARKLQEAEMLAEAARLEREGEKEAAEVVMEQAAKAPAPVVFVESTVPKQTGSVIKKPWTFRIVNPGLVPRDYMAIDESKIRKVVSALGANANIPGVETYQDDREDIRRK